MALAVQQLTARMLVRKRLWVGFLGAFVNLVLAITGLTLLPVQQSVGDTLAVHCSKTFPCPAEVRQRARFWMQVFSRWDNGTVALHDAANPQRVYAVMRSKRGCGRGTAPRQVERKRKKIRRQLRLLASKGLSSRFARSREGKRLLKWFPGTSSKQLRAAAGRIRCQQGNKDRFRRALQRFGRYRPMVEKALRNVGLPVDLKYLPFVESAYNPAAYSRVGAAGLWQIMPRTARTLGLQTGVAVDERLDPEQATLAAVRFFSTSRNSLLLDARRHRPEIGVSELMPFIVTSYNYGINGMRRAVKKLGPDFGKVLAKYRSPYFQTAVKNFYASFLAARQIVSHQQRYFPGVVAARPLRYTVVSLRRAASAKRLSKVFSVSSGTLRKLNPALTPTVWRNWQLVPVGYRLRLPPGTRRGSKALQRLARLPVETLGAIRYRVRRGDTACGIAARFAVSCRRLLARNRLSKRSLIRSGQKLYVPARRQNQVVRRVASKRKRLVYQPASISSVTSSQRKLSRNNAGRYTVRRGDSVCRIAKRFSISCQVLLRRNGLTARTVVRPGQQLVITRSRSTAANQRTEKYRISKQTASARRVAFQQLIKPPDAELDIQIHSKITRSGKIYRIRVQPEETLGHYADWLGLGSTGKLKRRNHLRRKHSMRVGQWLLLPSLKQPMIDKFERQRAGFHALLLDEFRSNFRLQRILRYRLRKGDSTWSLSRRFQVPWWLLTRMNPQLLDSSLQVGQVIRIPVIQPKSA